MAAAAAAAVAATVKPEDREALLRKLLGPFR
jgi:hypothetical protein